MIDLLLLGTGAMVPLPDRWLSSLLVRCRGQLTLFDCGEGTQIPWRRFGWGFRRLSAICLSHAHADHIAGLPGLLHTVANADRTEPLHIFGPVGIADAVDGLRVIARDLPYPVVVRELTGGEAFKLPGPLIGTAATAEHRIRCLAYRVSLTRTRRFDAERARELGIPVPLWSRLQRGEAVSWAAGAATAEEVLGPERRGLSFGFVTDTRPTDGLVQAMRGVDLLVCEATYGSSADQTKAARYRHMTFAEAAGLARAAAAKQLWLTHFSPALADPAAWLPEATALFSATTVGSSGLTTTLNFLDE